VRPLSDWRRENEHQDEAKNPADITGGPTGAGQSPILSGGTGRHHRVGKYGSEFDADGRDGVGEEQWRNDADVAGACQTTSGRTLSPASRRTPRSTACGDRWHPQSRPTPATSTQSSIPPPRGESPQGLAAGRVGRHVGREIGREDKVVIRVKNGSAAQAKKIQLITPSEADRSAVSQQCVGRKKPPPCPKCPYPSRGGVLLFASKAI